MTKLARAAVAAVLVLTACAPAHAKGPEAIRNLDDALARARKEGKLLFVQFGREACGNCQALKGYIAGGSVDLPSEFLYADVDCDDDATRKTFYGRFKVEGQTLPFVVIAGPDGSQLAGRTGFGRPEDFETLIKEARKAAPKGEGSAGGAKRGSLRDGGATASSIPRDETRESRTWTSESGTTVKAALIEASGGFAVLKTAAGTTVKMPVARLSSEDRAYLDGLKSGGAAPAGTGDGEAPRKAE